MGEYITIPLLGEVPLCGEEGVFIFNGYFEKCKKYIEDGILTSSGKRHRTPQNDKLKNTVILRLRFLKP
jgi:hypothetical protein